MRRNVALAPGVRVSTTAPGRSPGWACRLAGLPSGAGSALVNALSGRRQYFGASGGHNRQIGKGDGSIDILDGKDDIGFDSPDGVYRSKVAPAQDYIGECSSLQGSINFAACSPAPAISPNPSTAATSDSFFYIRLCGPVEPARRPLCKYVTLPLDIRAEFHADIKYLAGRRAGALEL